MRVIAGICRGRRLKGPEHDGLRPTSDKIRGAVMNSLLSTIDMDGAQILDVFCGTGALGIEALSRGGAHCTFIDKERRSIALCRENVRNCGLEDRAAFIHQDVRKALFPDEKSNLVFIDPPYGKGLVSKALDVLAQKNALATGACIVVETNKSEPVECGSEYRLLQQKTYGETDIYFLRYENGA